MEIISLNKKHDNELNQFISLQDKYEELAMAIEPPLKSIALNQLEVELSHSHSLLLSSRSRYERTKDLYQAPLPDIFIISTAVPDHNPVSPSLIMYVLLGLITGFIFSVTSIWMVRRTSELRNLMNKI